MILVPDNTKLAEAALDALARFGVISLPGGAYLPEHKLAAIEKIIQVHLKLAGALVTVGRMPVDESLVIVLSLQGRDFNIQKRLAEAHIVRKFNWPVPPYSADTTWRWACDATGTSIDFQRHDSAALHRHGPCRRLDHECFRTTKHR